MTDQRGRVIGKRAELSDDLKEAHQEDRSDDDAGVFRVHITLMNTNNCPSLFHTSSKMNVEPILRTDRLVLRPYREEDAEVIFELYATDTEVTRYLTWCPHQNLEETREFVRACIAAWPAGRDRTWAITLEDDTLVGSIALRINGHKADFGYVIGRPYWGRGYAGEALRAVVDHGLGRSGVFRVWGTCDVDNRASLRVMEKVGLQREGLLRAWVRHPGQGELPRDSWCYAMVKTASGRVDAATRKVAMEALARLCEKLNELELEGDRLAGITKELYLEDKAEDEYRNWIDSYRSKLLESWPQILAAEHPLRLAGYSQSVEPLREVVYELKLLYDRLDEDHCECTPLRVGEAVQEVFAKLDTIKTELYGRLI